MTDCGEVKFYDAAELRPENFAAACDRVRRALLVPGVMGLPREGVGGPVIKRVLVAADARGQVYFVVKIDKKGRFQLHDSVMLGKGAVLEGLVSDVDNSIVPVGG